MQRCLQCNSTLRQDEAVCYSCGSAPPEKNPKKKFHYYFRLALNAFVIMMAAVTVGSLVTDMFPSFKKCVAVLGILILVKKSADHMSEFGKDF
jgi:hypothetical protein